MVCLKKVFMLLLIVLFLVVPEVYNLYWHEQTHKTICEAGGGSAKVYYKINWYGLDGFTSCFHEDNFYNDINKEEELQLLNEIIGYNLSSLLVSFQFVFIVGFLVMMMLKNNNG